MLDDARRLVTEGGPDEVQGAVVPDGDGRWTYRLETAVHGDGDTSFLAHRRRLDALEAALRADGRWTYPHPWLTTFVNGDRAAAVVGAELDRLDPAADLGRLGQVVLSPIRRGAVTSPLLRRPVGALCFAFNLVRLPDTDDPVAVARLVAANRVAYERIRAASGRLYPVSAFPMAPPTGARTSGRRSPGWPRPGGNTIRAACSPRATKSFPGPCRNGGRPFAALEDEPSTRES